MRYCTGISSNCQHWGVIPQNYKELKHALTCPKCNGYMGPVGKNNPVEDAGYLSKDEVTPVLVNERTP